MSNLKIIAAIGKNGELGRGNDLIWRFREDLNFFRETTRGHYIAMGRKTYDSMPKNLPERRYVVITRGDVPPAGNLTVFKSIPDFLSFAHSIDEDIYVSGGGEIYRELLPHCGTLLLTEIDASAEAEVFFPKFDRSNYAVQKIGDFTDKEINYTRNIYTLTSRQK